MKKELTCENILNEMREYLDGDIRRIRHAESVFDFATQIHAVSGGDREIIEAAAALHDIGIHEAERKYGSPAGNYQEIEGPPIARRILERFDISEEKVNHICKIIANHHCAKDIDTLEFRIIWDADWLVNIGDEFDLENREKVEKIIKRVFKTLTGRELAVKRYLQ